MKPTDEPVVVEQEFDVSVEDVWKAITETEQMKLWFFGEMNEFDPTVGFKTRFDVECDGKHYIHTWKIIEVIPRQRIVYDWSYESQPGRGIVVWELEATDNSAILTVTNTVSDAFPEDDPVFHRDNCEAGWQYFINDRLKSYLQK